MSFVLNEISFIRIASAPNGLLKRQQDDSPDPRRFLIHGENQQKRYQKYLDYAFEMMRFACYRRVNTRCAWLHIAG